MFQAIKHQKIYQQVVERIQNMLLEGSLEKGDRLPSERELSEKFGVSRSSVREALRALEIIGIVESRQGGGNYIRSVFDYQVFEPLSVMFKLNKGSFHDILEYRKIFEPEIAAIAAKRITPENAVLLADLASQLKASKDEKNSTRIDMEIHKKIVDISGNYMLKTTMTAASVIMESFIQEARDLIFQWQENREELLNIHCRICDAIIKGDSDKASELTQTHFKIIIDNI
jgi:GntR family transcriptional repressor for pyruvate dehydrogenase complex